jgi:RecQ mediated genome instability protein
MQLQRIHHKDKVTDYDLCLTLTQAWVQPCYDWIVSSKGVAPDPPNYPKIIAAIQEQILKADLFDATIEKTGLPLQVGSRETTMRIAGPPVLVQIKALTDVGISAFKLEEVRKAREERLQSGLGTEEDGEDEGDIELEGEGPMPKYPRGTLMFELYDGTTTLKAMEYKPLPQLSLLTTPLGYKVSHYM